MALGKYCYTMTASEKGQSKPIGVTFQSIMRQQVNGVDSLAVIVHQHLSNGKFDMKDSFLLRRSDLRPIRLDTDRDGAHYVHLDYTEHGISGWKIVKGVKSPIDVSLQRSSQSYPSRFFVKDGEKEILLPVEKDARILL